METIAAQALVPDLVRQPQLLLHLGHGVVEGGVETGHLRQVGHAVHQCGNGFQRVGLMQRGQRDVALQVGQHLGIHAHRMGILGAAMHDTVCHTDEPTLTHTLADPRTDVVDRGDIRTAAVIFGTQRAAGGIGVLVGDIGAANVHRLAAPHRALGQRMFSGIVQGELDAGGTTVQDQDQPFVEAGFGNVRFGSCAHRGKGRILCR